MFQRATTATTNNDNGQQLPELSKPRHLIYRSVFGIILCGVTNGLWYAVYGSDLRIGLFQICEVNPPPGSPACVATGGGGGASNDRDCTLGNIMEDLGKAAGIGICLLHGLAILANWYSIAKPLECYDVTGRNNGAARATSGTTTNEYLNANNNNNNNNGAVNNTIKYVRLAAKYPYRVNAGQALIMQICVLVLFLAPQCTGGKSMSAYGASIGPTMVLPGMMVIYNAICASKEASWPEPDFSDYAAAANLNNNEMSSSNNNNNTHTSPTVTTTTSNNNRTPTTTDYYHNNNGNNVNVQFYPVPPPPPQQQQQQQYHQQGFGGFNQVHNA